MEKITIKHIANKLGLSIATVSRAVNPQTQHLVKQNTRDKVLTLIESEHYIPSPAAKALATGRSYNIVVFFRPEASSVFFDDYYSKMIAGSMNAVSGTDYNLVMSVIKDEEGGFDIEKAVRKMDVAAAILVNFLGVHKLSAKNIFNLDVPILVINQYREEENPNCFLIDNFKSSYEATQYLINKGHRRIGFVRGLANVKDAQDRYLGFLQALKDNGISHNENLDYQTDFSEEAAVFAVRYFFSGKSKPPSALFFVNDTMAMIAMNELRKLGITCPKDISVMGFDGIDAGRYTDPPLTTVLQPIYDMAGEAVREAMNILEAKKRFKGTRYFTAKIIERGSVASYRE
ncbi:MAG TPA: LacI family DNA-binding transcriptional regulator [Candidatus Omnitrophota bacterium]|nr:LacI family DNA-binding transcriptional regulator [Candidatus Omnitrophota bacterium]